MYAYNNTGGPYAIELDHVAVTDFQKTGMALMGDGPDGERARLHDHRQGLHRVTAQNGIQLSDGATGAITACKVTDIGYTGTGWAASGLLVPDAAGTVTVSNMKGANKIDNVQAPINWYTSNGTVDGVEIANSAKADVGVRHLRLQLQRLAAGRDHRRGGDARAARPRPRPSTVGPGTTPRPARWPPPTRWT